MNVIKQLGREGIKFLNYVVVTKLEYIEHSLMVLDLRFLEWWLLRVLSSGIYRHVVLWKSTYILKEHIASIFRAIE
jgi:hypothetical protein